MTFTHLHVHSHYSMLDGMSKIPDLVNKCLDTGMNAIALTDHGNMFGIKEFLDYCKKINKKNKEGFIPFKPIVGVEAYCARRSRKNKDKNFKEVRNGKEIIVDYSGWHLILLAKNKVGYRNLCKLVSASYMEDSFYGKPRIDKDLLEQYHEGIICSSACLAGEVPQKILQKKLTEAEESIKWFKNLFGDEQFDALVKGVHLGIPEISRVTVTWLDREPEEIKDGDVIYGSNSKRVLWTIGRDLML